MDMQVFNGITKEIDFQAVLTDVGKKQKFDIRRHLSQYTIYSWGHSILLQFWALDHSLTVFSMIQDIKQKQITSVKTYF